MQKIYEKSKNFIEIYFQKKFENILAFLFSQVIFSYFNENYFSFLSIYGKFCLYLLYFSVLIFFIFSIKKIKFDSFNLLLIFLSLFCLISIIYNNEIIYSFKELLKIIFLLFLFNICNNIDIDKFYQNFISFFKIFFSVFLIVLIFGSLKLNFLNENFATFINLYEKEGINFFFLKNYFSSFSNLLVPFNAIVHYYIFSIFLIFNLKNLLRKNLIFCIFNFIILIILILFFNLTLINVLICIFLISYFLFYYLKFFRGVSLKIFLGVSILFPVLAFISDPDLHSSRYYSKFLYNFAKVTNSKYSDKFYLKNYFFINSYDFDMYTERYHPRIPIFEKHSFSIIQNQFNKNCIPTFTNSNLDLFDFLIEDIYYEELELNTEKNNFKINCKHLLKSKDFLTLRNEAADYLNNVVKKIDSSKPHEKEYLQRILSKEYPFILIDWNFFTDRNDLPPFYQIYYSLKSRLHILKQHTKIVSDNFIFGLGGYIPSRDWNINSTFKELDQNKPHNTFISFAEMYGIFALLVFSLILFILIHKIEKKMSIGYFNYVGIFFFLLICNIEDYTVGASFNTFAIQWLFIFLMYHKKDA